MEEEKDIAKTLIFVAATFEVNDKKKPIVVALVSQVRYRFSITVTQLDCDDVPEFMCEWGT